MTAQTPPSPFSPVTRGAPGDAPGPARTNTLAIVSLVAAFVAPLIGLVLGLVARGQVRRSGENGRGLATAAIVLGSVFSAIWIAAVVALVAVGGSVSGSFTTASVPAASVEARIVEQSGLPAGSVRCAGDLPAQVGSTTACTATVDGVPTPVTATVTSVDGDDVRFSFRQN